MSEEQKDLAKVIEKYFGADAGYLDIDVFTLARRILEAGWKKTDGNATANTWISVNDRLPNEKKVIDGDEYKKNVAVRIKALAPEKIAFYDEDAGGWFDTDFLPLVGEVTHWAPLP